MPILLANYVIGMVICFPVVVVEFKLSFDVPQEASLVEKLRSCWPLPSQLRGSQWLVVNLLFSAGGIESRGFFVPFVS